MDAPAPMDQRMMPQRRASTARGIRAGLMMSQRRASTTRARGIHAPHEGTHSGNRSSRDESIGIRVRMRLDNCVHADSGGISILTCIGGIFESEIACMMSRQRIDRFETSLLRSVAACLRTSLELVLPVCTNNATLTTHA